jgi:hypothetical protein
LFSQVLYFQVVVTAPSVPYKLIINEKNVKKMGARELLVSSPADWLDRTLVEEYQVLLWGHGNPYRLERTTFPSTGLNIEKYPAPPPREGNMSQCLFWEKLLKEKEKKGEM